MKVNLGGTEINFEVLGNGEPVICLHGWNEDCGVFKSRMYRKLLEGHRVYAIDLPGFGASDRLEKYSFDALNHLLEQFGAHAGLDRFHLLGQCMGGIFALDYAIRHPETISKLTLVETMIYFPIWLHLLFIRRLDAWALNLLLKRKIGGRLLDFYKALRKTRKDKRLQTMLKRTDVSQSLEYIRLMRSYSRYDHIERAKVLEMPVTIITAENTFPQVRKTANHLVGVLRNARILRIPGRNHFIYVD